MKSWIKMKKKHEYNLDGGWKAVATKHFFSLQFPLRCELLLQSAGEEKSLI